MTRRRNDQKNTRKKKSQPSKRRKITRRKLLSTAALGAAAFYIIRTHTRNDEWGFLERAYQGHDHFRVPLDAFEVARMGVNLPVVPLLSDQAKLRGTLQANEAKIFDNIAQKGASVKDYTFTPTLERIVIPDRSKYANQLAEYCKRATEFMYNHPEMQELTHHSIEWNVLRKNTPRAHINTNGNIGLLYYDAHTIRASHRYNLKHSFSVKLTTPFDNAHLYIHPNEEGKLRDWHIVVSSLKPTVMVKAPFAEVIPLTLHERTVLYREEVGYEKATIAAEALSEALAHELALEAIDTFSIPYSKETLEQSAKGAGENPLYSRLPAALSWVRQHSMREALALYIDSPARFMAAIS